MENIFNTPIMENIFNTPIMENIFNTREQDYIAIVKTHLFFFPKAFETLYRTELAEQIARERARELGMDSWKSLYGGILMGVEYLFAYQFRKATDGLGFIINELERKVSENLDSDTVWLSLLSDDDIENVKEEFEGKYPDLPEIVIRQIYQDNSWFFNLQKK